MSTETPTPRRRYEKRARATKERETRQRIVEAALTLHGTVGPARTTISAIAEQAGERRPRRAGGGRARRALRLVRAGGADGQLGAARHGLGADRRGDPVRALRLPRRHRGRPREGLGHTRKGRD